MVPAAVWLVLGAAWRPPWQVLPGGDGDGGLGAPGRPRHSAVVAVLCTHLHWIVKVVYCSDGGVRLFLGSTERLASLGGEDPYCTAAVRPALLGRNRSGDWLLLGDGSVLECTPCSWGSSASTACSSWFSAVSSFLAVVFVDAEEVDTAVELAQRGAGLAVAARGAAAGCFLATAGFSGFSAVSSFLAVGFVYAEEVVTAVELTQRGAGFAVSARRASAGPRRLSAQKKSTSTQALLVLVLASPGVLVPVLTTLRRGRSS